MAINSENRSMTRAEAYRTALLRNKKLCEIETIAKKINSGRSHLSLVLNGSRNMSKKLEEKLEEYFKEYFTRVP